MFFKHLFLQLDTQQNVNPALYGQNYNLIIRQRCIDFERSPALQCPQLVLLKRFKTSLSGSDTNTAMLEPLGKLRGAKNR